MNLTLWKKTHRNDISLSLFFLSTFHLFELSTIYMKSQLIQQAKLVKSLTPIHKMCSSFSLEIKIRNVEGLTVKKKLVWKNVFVTVSTEDGVYIHNNQISTGISEEGDATSLTWNEKLTMKIPVGTKFVLLEIRQKTRSKEKSIAVARVPISDFVNDYMPQNYEHFLSYRLRNYDSEPNGIINFSVNVRGNNVGTNVHYYKASEVHGYGCTQSYVSKPCNRTPYIDGVVVGVPANWFNA